MLIELEGFITYYHPSWQNEPTFSWTAHRPYAGGDTFVIKPHKITIEVDPDWDPTNSKLMSLYEQRDSENLRHAQKVTEIESEIANLLALPAPAR